VFLNVIKVKEIPFYYETCSLLFSGVEELKGLDGIQTTFNFEKIKNKIVS